MTVVHEFAHHHDRTRRVRRGRWRADGHANLERYAEKMEYEWTAKFGIPWLQRRFPEEVSALLAWIQSYVGISLPLSFFAGDPRQTNRDGSTRLTKSTSALFEDFVMSLVDEDSPAPLSQQIRLDFAWNLYCADKYELCLQFVEDILGQDPSCYDALHLRADTCVRLERHDEAWDITERLLAARPSDGLIWGIQADILELRNAWSELLELCARCEAAIPAENLTGWAWSRYRAVACCALGHYEEMVLWIKQTVRVGSSSGYAKRVVQGIHRRAGNPIPWETMVEYCERGGVEFSE